MKQLILCLTILILNSGCVHSPEKIWTARYKKNVPILSARPSDKVLVIVQDNRQEITTGKRRENFEATVNGAFGIPTGVATLTGFPLAEELGRLIVEAFKQAQSAAELQTVSYKKGIEELARIAAERGSHKTIVLRIDDWTTFGGFFGGKYSLDAETLVLNKSGQILASKRVTDAGEFKVGRTAMEKYPAIHALRIEKCLNESIVVNAINVVANSAEETEMLAAASNDASKSNDGSKIRKRLLEIEALLKEKLITEDEYQRMRRHIIQGL